MILSIPGSFTDPKNWIVQSCMRAWEFVEKQKHLPRTGTSGATDANILRAAGIPTARLGMPRRTTANRESAQPSFRWRPATCRHETAYQMFDLCSHRYLHAGAARSSPIGRGEAVMKNSLDDQILPNEAWNLAPPTMWIRSRQRKVETSPWPRYDEAALGFRNYWYPAMMSHKLRSRLCALAEFWARNCSLFAIEGNVLRSKTAARIGACRFPSADANFPAPTRLPAVIMDGPTMFQTASVLRR